jgi:UDP-N-acetylglucosamine transferase subunit ALG13
MILVTVGTEQFPFDRLMRWTQVLIDRGFIQEEIVVQYGSCTVWPSGVKASPLFSQAQFKDLVHQSDLIISHCGEGTLLLLETVHKPYILVPRSKNFGEHVDDHQVELATVLGQLELPIAWFPGDLVRFLASPKWIPPGTFSTLDFCQNLRNRFDQN